MKIEKHILPARKTRRHVLLAQYWWEDRLLRGVARYAMEHDWTLECRMRWVHIPPNAAEWHGDGIIAYAGVSRPLKSLIELAQSSRVPVVDLQEHGDPFGAPKVAISQSEISRLAAQYLLSVQFRNCGYVTFEENALEAIRRDAFQKAISEAAARFFPLHMDSFPEEVKRLPKPMGLVAVNDYNVIAVMRACLEAGFRIPDDFAVLGVDDTEVLCDLSPVSLSSVNCNYERQGYEAAALLDRLMDGEPRPAHHIILPPLGVTVRRSTDTIAMDDPDAARALRYLRDNYLRKITPAEMARELGSGLKRVQKIFRAKAGRSIMQELVRLRVEHARVLLEKSAMKMESVGVESGFANRFQFIRSFSKIMGQTPTEFRRKLPKGQRN